MSVEQLKEHSKMMKYQTYADSLARHYGVKMSPEQLEKHFGPAAEARKISILNEFAALAGGPAANFPSKRRPAGPGGKTNLQRVLEILRLLNDGSPSSRGKKPSTGNARLENAKRRLELIRLRDK